MSEKLTAAQVEMLRRFAAGDRVRSRLNFMFCFSERAKYVRLWESDKTVANASTFNAICRRGYYTAGEITDAGRAALAATLRALASQEPTR